MCDHHLVDTLAFDKVRPFARAFWIGFTGMLRRLRNTVIYRDSLLNPTFPLGDDGANAVLGRSWWCMTADGRVQVLYHHNVAHGMRHHAGTFFHVASSGRLS